MSEHPAAVTAFLDQGETLLIDRGTSVETGKYPRVLVAAEDLESLRGREPISAGVKAPVIGVFVESADEALSVRAKPEWPTLMAVRSNAGRDGVGWLLVLRFARPAQVGQVVAEVARQAVWPDRRGNEGVWEHDARKVEADPESVLPQGGIAPFDERVVNPIGWSRDVEPVHVGWDAPEATREAVRLAMTGVPLTADPMPASVRAELTEQLAAAIESAPDLTDPLRREQHSLTLRRAALDEHSFGAWRRRSAVRVAPEPSVSVVLATKRPEMLDHALDQIEGQTANQDGRVEVILLPHGWEPEPLDHPDVTLLPQPADMVFGDVLNEGVDAASGDLILKWDDDDWYAPDFIDDLLRARRYSAAELVGAIPTYTYLEQSDRTVESGDPTEKYTNFVAGGTMLIGRSDLRELGGFRAVPRWVDAQLLAAVWKAGGAIYRTHGLGYVLRRAGSGHTWHTEDQAIIDSPSTVAVHDGLVLPW